MSRQQMTDTDAELLRLCNYLDGHTATSAEQDRLLSAARESVRLRSDVARLEALKPFVDYLPPTDALVAAITAAEEALAATEPERMP